MLTVDAHRWLRLLERSLIPALFVLAVVALALATATSSAAHGPADRGGRVVLVFDVRGGLHGRTNVGARLRGGFIRARFDTSALRLGKRQGRFHRILLRFSARPLCAGRLGRMTTASVEAHRVARGRFLAPRGRLAVPATCSRPARLGAFVAVEVVAGRNGFVLARSAGSIPVLNVERRHARR